MICEPSRCSRQDYELRSDMAQPIAAVLALTIATEGQAPSRLASGWNPPRAPA